MITAVRPQVGVAIDIAKNHLASTQSDVALTINRVKVALMHAVDDADPGAPLSVAALTAVAAETDGVWRVRHLFLDGDHHDIPSTGVPFTVDTPNEVLVDVRIVEI